MCFSVLGQRVFSIFLNIVPVIDVSGQSLFLWNHKISNKNVFILSALYEICIKSDLETSEWQLRVQTGPA